VEAYDDPEDETDDHLLMLNDTVGPLPGSLYTLSTRSSRCCTSDRVQFDTIDDALEGADPFSNKLKPLEEFFDGYKPAKSVERRN
jgi:hypothetical protein